MQLTKCTLTPGYVYDATVTRIVDGDTIEVELNLGLYTKVEKQTIRFWGINAPETHGKTKAMGLRSKEFVKCRLLGGTNVIIETFKDKRKGGDKRGSFNRWLGLVWYKRKTKNGRSYRWINLNEELVRKKLAIRFKERKS